MDYSPRLNSPRDSSAPPSPFQDIPERGETPTSLTHRPPDAVPLAQLRALRNSPVTPPEPIGIPAGATRTPPKTRHYSRPFRPSYYYGNSATHPDEDDDGAELQQVSSAEHNYEPSTVDVNRLTTHTDNLLADRIRDRANVVSSIYSRNSTRMSTHEGAATSPIPSPAIHNDDDKDSVDLFPDSLDESMDEKRALRDITPVPTSPPPVATPWSAALDPEKSFTSPTPFGVHQFKGESTDDLRDDQSFMSHNNSSRQLYAFAAPGARKKNGSPTLGKKANTTKRRKWIWLVLVALLLILVGAGVGIYFWRSHANKANSKDATSSNGDTSGNGTTTPNLTSPGSGGQFGYNTIVAFGSSWADNGHDRPSQYSFSQSASPYAGKRWTNGPVYPEYLQSMVGPRASANATGLNATLLDYSYSGSSVDNTIVSTRVPDLAGQIQSYIGDLKGANSSVSSTITSKHLITVWIGLDPLRSLWFNITDSNNATQTGHVADVVTRSVDGIISLLASITNDVTWPTGAAPDYLLVPLPPGTMVPSAATNSRAPSSATIFGNITSQFNNELANAAFNLTTQVKTTGSVYISNMPNIMQDMATNQSKYNLTEITASCTSLNCSNAAGFLWYDDNNPTSRIHQIFAQDMANTILAPS